MKLKNGSRHLHFRATFLIQMTFPLLNSPHTKSTWNRGLLLLFSKKNSAYPHHSSSAYFLLLFSYLLWNYHSSILHLESTQRHNFLVPPAQRDLACFLLQASDHSHYWWSWAKVSWGSVEAKDFQTLWKFATLHAKKKAQMQSTELQG